MDWAQQLPVALKRRLLTVATKLVEFYSEIVRGVFGFVLHLGRHSVARFLKVVCTQYQPFVFQSEVKLFFSLLPSLLGCLFLRHQQVDIQEMVKMGR